MQVDAFGIWGLLVQELDYRVLWIEIIYKSVDYGKEGDYYSIETSNITKKLKGIVYLALNVIQV